MLWEMIMNKGNFTMTEEIFRSNADYHNLKCYQKSVIIYDGTYFFCRRFLASGDRTIDQMVQAARSGKQNIVEGVMAWNTSSETMLKLLGVAKASLEELLEDYLDYLRTRNLPLWEKDSRPAAKVRRLGKLPGGSADIFRDYMMNRSDGTCANIMICLIHQCSYLIARLQQSAMANFAREGGFREKLSRIRQKKLQEQSSGQYRKGQ